MDEKNQAKEEPKTGIVQVPPQVQAILSNPIIAKFYANGFIGGRTQTDLFAISVFNGNPQFVVNMSFSTAKNLYKFLDEAIKEIEQILEQEIKSLPILKNN